MKSSKKKGSFLFLLIVSGLALMLSGCATPKYLVAPYDPPRTIALLPMDNQTADLVGPKYLRFLFKKYLAEKGYNVIDSSYVDSKLNEAGITDGGQLSSMTPKEIGKIVGAEAVIYGTLTDFNYTNIGIYYQRKVAANFKMFSSRSGDLLWEDERKKENSEIALSGRAIAETFAGGILDKLVEGMFQTPLGAESREVVNIIVSTIPKCPKP